MVSETTSVKDWYTDEYPSDPMGMDIRSDVTFEDVFNTLDGFKSFYHLIEAADSIIRERVFAKLAELIGVDYDCVYDQWLLCDENEEDQ
jgi:hypothetical protein